MDIEGGGGGGGEGHSLERILLTLSDSCPLPLGWACLRQPEDDRSILFAHVAVDEKLDVRCDRTILLSPMMTEKSSCLVQVTFTETESSSSPSPSNSTSLLIRDLTDVENLLRVSFKDEESGSWKREAKNTTGSPSRPSDSTTTTTTTTTTKREREGVVDLEQIDSPLVKRYKSPSPVASSSDVNVEAVSMALAPAAPSAPSAFNPSIHHPGSSNPFKKSEKERPYTCPECDKTFTRGNHLKDHMRIHAGETYECPVCQYQCILQTKFTHHLTSHNNRGPFPCQQCGKMFERAHDLARHLPVDHQIDTGFRLSHFKNNFSPAQFKDKSAQPQNLLSIAGRPLRPLRPAFYPPRPAFPPRPALPPSFPSISSAPVTITDFGDGSFEDMQRLMRLYGGGGGGGGGRLYGRGGSGGGIYGRGGEEDDDDDSVIPIDDDDDEEEEEYSRVKSLDDEFGDDAILVE